MTWYCPECTIDQGFGARSPLEMHDHGYSFKHGGQLYICHRCNTKRIVSQKIFDAPDVRDVRPGYDVVEYGENERRGANPVKAVVTIGVLGVAALLVAAAVSGKGGPKS